MKLGLDLSYPTSVAGLDASLELAVAAERLGLDRVSAAEAYGGDAVTVLAAVAARTERIDIASSVLQIPGRTPAMTAMTAVTLDALSHGRFRLGLGVSGPQVSEGWHGVAFGKPLGRTREYIGIVRDAIARKRVTAAGEHFTLPLPGGQGKSLALSLDPLRRQIPIYLAAVGPRNLALAAELADGWLGIFLDAATLSDPDSPVGVLTAALAANGRDRAGFDLCATMSLSVDDDLAVAADRVRPHAALYIGGMGSKKTNFYHGIASRMGFERQADQVQEAFLARDYAAAAAAVPLEFLDRVALLGDEARIAERLSLLAAAGIDTVNVLPLVGSPASPAGQLDPVARAETLSVLVAAADRAGVRR